MPSAHDPKLMRLLRVLAFLCAVHNITLSASHTPGVDNVAADALLRNNLPVFFASNPQASQVPSGVPLCLQELVFNQAHRWISSNWNLLFSTTLAIVSHLLPKPPTQLPSDATSLSAERQV